jgi:hypothetical protein
MAEEATTQTYTQYLHKTIKELEAENAQLRGKVVRILTQMSSAKFYLGVGIGHAQDILREKDDE